jgi:hypothetical protein
MDLCTGLAKKFNLKQVKFNAAEKSGVNKKFTS